MDRARLPRGRAGRVRGGRRRTRTAALACPRAHSPREAETALDTVMRETAEAEERSASLTANQERLTRAIDHLKTSLAQLAVLRAAAAEANATFNRIRSFVPSK